MPVIEHPPRRGEHLDGVLALARRPVPAVYRRQVQPRAAHPAARHHAGTAVNAHSPWWILGEREDSGRRPCACWWPRTSR